MTSNNRSIPTTEKLREALDISSQIEKLQNRLNQIFGTGSSAPETATSSDKPASGRGGRRTMSAAGRARIAAAARERWAKIRGESQAAKPAKKTSKKKGGLTPEGRARLAASMKARWAERRKAGA